MNKREIQAVIFDVDGTLLNTEPIYFKSDIKLLNEYGITLSAEENQEYIGIGNIPMLLKVKERYNIKDDIHNMLNRKNQFYMEFARNEATIFPQMEKLIKELKKISMPMAVASGSSYEPLMELMNILNIKDYFKFILSSEQVENGKPEPDVFLKAAELLRINPSNILVLEDSYVGVLAAKRALMYCAAIPSVIARPLDDIFFQADLLFEKGMDDFEAEKVLAWIQEERVH